MTGILTVARLEMTIRIRAGRWRWLLGGWLVVLVVFTVLLRVALAHSNLPDTRGTVMYGSLQLFLLALGLLVMPTLTAQSVNGDRERGTLGVLQVTRLTAFDIAMGKLLAAWAIACIFLVLSAPLVAWAMLEGGVPVVRVVIVTIVMALIMGVVCAIALGFSSLLARGTTSSVLSYVAVFALTAGTLVAFGLVTAATAQTQTVNYGNGYSGPQRVDRTDETWVVLAPNPFVVLADAAPVAGLQRVRCITYANNGVAQSGYCDSDPGAVDPLGDISRAVRGLRTAPNFAGSGGPQTRNGGLVWPYGLGFDVLLAAFMMGVATRRLRTPRHRLARGMRLG